MWQKFQMISCGTVNDSFTFIGILLPTIDINFILKISLIPNAINLYLVENVYFFLCCFILNSNIFDGRHKLLGCWFENIVDELAAKSYFAR